MTPPQSNTAAAPQRRSALLLAAAACLVAGLVASLRTYLNRDGFNMDELFQVAFINTPLPGFFAQFIRLDQHPPFHFLQLVPWSAVSDSDAWLLFNSVAWHLVSCAVIAWVGRAWLGATAGLLAAALYALMPQVVMASATLRFYAMMPALAVLAWWLNVTLLSDTAHRARRWWALAAVQVALAYSHAIGFYFVFWIALAAAVQQGFALRGRAPWRRWSLVQAGVAALILPQVVMTAARAMMARGEGISVGGNNDPGSLVDHLGGMTAGWGMEWHWARVAGTALFLLAVLLGLRRPATRWMAAVLLVGPYAAATLIGLVLTPMFKTPVYSAMLVPFACLALAGGFAQARRWQAAAVVALLVAMAVFVFPASAHLNRGVSPYRPVAAELRKLARPGDLVVLPEINLFWAVLRYNVAPNWGSPLEVLPPLSGSWLAMTQRLGQPLASALKLLPRTNHLEHGGITFVIGPDPGPLAASAHRLWYAGRPNVLDELKPVTGFTDRGRVFRAGQGEVIEIQLLERQAAPGS